MEINLISYLFITEILFSLMLYPKFKLCAFSLTCDHIFIYVSVTEYLIFNIILILNINYSIILNIIF